MEMLKVDQISRMYGSQLAVDNLSFIVEKGHIHGFLGPNGAGKTTTMKIIAGIIPPHFGDIYLEGNSNTQSIEYRKNLGLLLESPPLYLDMKVIDYLAFVARLHGADKDRVNSLVDQVIDRLSLSKVAHRLCANLSKGYKQRVGVAQAIVHLPRLVILDEPTVGLDPEAVHEMREFIKSLKNDHTVLFSSHLLHEVELISDEVTIINNGKLIASGAVDQITQSLRDQNIYYLELQRISKDQIEILKNLYYVNEIKLEITKHSTALLNIFINSVEGHRHEIIRKVIEMNLEVLSFNQHKMSLEDIFIRMTKDNNKEVQE